MCRSLSEKNGIHSRSSWESGKSATSVWFGVARGSRIQLDTLTQIIDCDTHLVTQRRQMPTIKPKTTKPKTRNGFRCLGPFTPSSSKTTHSLVLLVLLNLLITSTIAVLTQNEQRALRQIFENHPDLGSVPSWETIDDDGVFYGHSWNNSFENLCQSDGYGFYGVYCVGGHVSGIRVTTYWGDSLFGQYSASSGLTFLANYSETLGRTANGLLRVLTAVVPLRHVQTELLSPQSFSYPASLLSLAGSITDNFPFDSMPNLLSLNIQFVQLEPDLSPLCGFSTLKELLYSGTGFSEFINLVNCLPSLQRASFYTDEPVSSSGYILSASLNYLHITMYENVNSSVEIDCSSLEDLSLLIYGETTINVMAPNLKRFDFSSSQIFDSFTSFINLESFIWTGYSANQSEIPNMSFAPNLRSVHLEDLTITNLNVSDIWASLPITIENLTLRRINFLGRFAISFPSSWTSLKSLLLEDFLGVSLDLSSILSKTSLRELTILGDGPITSLEEFYALPNLALLHLRWPGFFGPKIQIPTDFFIRMNQLTDILLASGFSLTGAIPWLGWENLERVVLMGQLETWPTIQGSANRLKDLTISTQNLTMIPTDDSFRAANFQSLRMLAVWARNLKAMPFFWTDLPNIKDVELDTGNYSSPFQRSISAPQLRSLVLRTKFCGPLPDFGLSTHLNRLWLSSNYFSGSIPRSWEDNLSLIGQLVLSNNFLNGTIPPHLFDHHVDYRSDLFLENNAFTGPLWNMSAGVPQQLSIGGTGLDVCSQDPDIRSSPETVYCYFSTLPRCPSRCANFWTSCISSGGCTERRLVARPPPTCSLADETCPLPQPGRGFQCNRGAWILVGNTSNLSLSLPPAGGTIYIFGDVSTNGTITFSGTETSLNIQGCVLEKPAQVVIELPSETTVSNVTLITQYGTNCSTDLSKIPIVLISPKNECRKSVGSSSDTRSSLTVLFSIEDTCHKSKSSNTRWIILGSAIGVVLFLSLAGVILHQKSPIFRSFIRMCTVRRSSSSKRNVN